MNEHYIIPSVSRSMSPMSIAIKSSDIRRSRDCSSTRKHVLLTRTRSNSIELVDHDFNCVFGPALKKGVACSINSSPSVSRPTSLSIPTLEEENHPFARKGNVFIHIETHDNDAEDIAICPVSPTDFDVSSPTLILRDQYRRRFFQESGFNLLPEIRTPTAKLDEVQK